MDNKKKELINKIISMSLDEFPEARIKNLDNIYKGYENMSVEEVEEILNDFKTKGVKQTYLEAYREINAETKGKES